jgi:hypothetical protein
MYSIVAQALGGNEEHMAGYFPLVMGQASLLWLDNLLVECSTRGRLKRSRCRLEGGE